MEILDKAKEMLDSDIQSLKDNKQSKVDQDELKKKFKEADEKKQKELKALKDTEQYQKSKTTGDYHARVRLYVTSGTRREQIADLGAYYGHKEGKQTLKVLNKDNETIFEEVKPDWQNTYRYSDEETLKNKISNLKTILKQFQNGDIREKKDEKSQMTYYEEDYLAMLRQAEQEFSILVLGAEGTYSESINGLENYCFDVLGFFKIPMFYYTSKAILGLPPAGKIMTGQYLFEVLYKDFKSDETRAEKIALTLIAIGFVVAFLGSIFMLYHYSGIVVDLVNSNADLASSYASSINVTDSLNTIADKIGITNNLLNNPVTGQNITKVIK